MKILSIDQKLASMADYGFLFPRIAFGIHLLYYSWGSVTSLDVSGDASWLAAHGVPLPTLAAWAYLFTEFLGGMALIIGFRVRMFAVPLIITFLVAYFMVHLNDSYQDAYPALQMLAMSCFFLFAGSGKPSLDEWINQRKSGE
ncbi:DoxX family protein [Ekhidna sp.]|uniref:DoxX family protein n=1 Tax=Ekhidna sp. TaxID=2608089 RepID=UPI0035112254